MGEKVNVGIEEGAVTADNNECKPDEADRLAEQPDERLEHSEVFGKVRNSIKANGKA